MDNCIFNSHTGTFHYQTKYRAPHLEDYFPFNYYDRAMAPIVRIAVNSKEPPNPDMRITYKATFTNCQFYEN